MKFGYLGLRNKEPEQRIRGTTEIEVQPLRLHLANKLSLQIIRQSNLLYDYRSLYPIDKENLAFTYENFGVRVSDDKKSPFHGMSTHNIGIMYFQNGVGRLRGYIYNVDKDGDKVVMELTEEGIKMGSNPISGKAEIVGGTGKFKGIQGSSEYTRTMMQPAAEGTHQAISRGKGTWKIVEPTN